MFLTENRLCLKKKNREPGLADILRGSLPYEIHFILYISKKAMQKGNYPIGTMSFIPMMRRD